MYPPVWGPVFWRTLHILTITTHLALAPEVITTLCMALPCPSCSSHASAYLKTHPINSNSRDELIDWGITFHNSVNARLGKPILSLEDGKADVLQYLNNQLERHRDIQNDTPVSTRQSTGERVVVGFTVTCTILCFFLLVWRQRRKEKAVENI